MRTLVTKSEVNINFRGHSFVIPKGTSTTHQTACGIDEKYNFINDLSFINKKENYGAWHDAYYYGINIPLELLEEKVA